MNTFDKVKIGDRISLPSRKISGKVIEKGDKSLKIYWGKGFTVGVNNQVINKEAVIDG